MYSAFATPSPDESVGLAEVSEIAPEAQPTLRYSIESQPVVGGPDHWRALYVIDSVTGNQVRLGNDSGTAVYGVMNDEYFLWFFLCDSCQDVQPGLHAYSLRTNRDTWIMDKVYHTLGSVKIDRHWALYMSPLPTSSYLTQLYAYNLNTGEILPIADDAVFKLAGTERYNAINEDMVAWVAVDLATQEASVKVYDLTRRTTQQIKRPQPFDPRNLNVSRNVVVWQGWYWQGYDLTRDALFTIPVVPPGWSVDSIRGAGPVTVRGRQIFWVLDVNGQARHFTASVVERGPATPEPTDEVPVPTTTVEPTSYP
jgi:hypothetical protein